MQKEQAGKISSAPLRVAMVGYLNTVPLVYGLQHGQGQYDLDLLIPAECYTAFDTGRVDVALVPVGVLPLLQQGADIVTDYCIGCTAAVRTVCLLTNVPIHDVKKIHLDTHSRTSVLLTRVLMAHHWCQDVSYESSNVTTIAASDLGDGEAVLMIGDKVFDVEGQYRYSYDLGEQWYEMTGLPFAFAVWVAKPDVSQATIDQLSADLAHGVMNIPASLAEHKEEDLAFDLDEYFREHIDYHFNDGKKEAVHIFLQMIGGLPNPSF